jgi:ABC-type phosphate/phosphonate transport system substrate-binding protein
MKRRALMLGALVAALMVCGACVNVTVAAARAQTDATANCG